MSAKEGRKPVTNQVTAPPDHDRHSQTQPAKPLLWRAVTRPSATPPDESARHGKEKVCRFDSVTGFTEIHLLGQVRSSLDSSNPKLRMGAVPCWEESGRSPSAGPCTAQNARICRCSRPLRCRAPAGIAPVASLGLWPRDVRWAVLVEWMRPGGHGSADPGLGMNRAPDRLYPPVVVVLGSCRCGLAENDVACFPSGLEKQRREPVRTLMARDVFVR